MSLTISSLTMQDASIALKQGLALIAEGRTELDLGAVTELDSAAVATLLEWQRAAQARGVHLQYKNMPASLKSLAQLYGVDTLLSA